MEHISSEPPPTRRGGVLVPGETVSLSAMVQQVRRFAWGGFLILRLDDGYVQAVSDDPQALEAVTEGATVRVRGEVRAADVKAAHVTNQKVEIGLQEIVVRSAPTGLPPVDLHKPDLDLTLEVKLDHRPVSLRHPKERAIFRVAARLGRAFRKFLDAEAFIEIHSPKICSTGAEGGANIFSLDYFGRRAFLAQSPQFYKQMGVGIFGRVYEIGSVFRAEPHATSRHLNEYVSLDFEMGPIDDFRDVMRMEAALLTDMMRDVASDCAADLALLGATVPDVPATVPSITLAEAHEIVHDRHGKDHRGEPDLAPEEEELLSRTAREELSSEFLFVTHYPSAKRPFYTFDDPERPGETCSFDLLFRGVEITTGGQRIHDHAAQVAKLVRFGLDPADFESFLQIHRAGMPPHGGLAIGLERLTARLLGLANVKEASLFPRDVNRLTP